ncbi:DciA family protein [Noviherbaspirillum humi]|uniref:DciA family protein n=1 Tax=Noviherbaspirillum humi TaxID=1688639 RepID=UPI001FEC9AE2|nr:DciA family protein [Noviherbaspirillum humi]
MRYKASPTYKGVTEFLNADNKLATLLPAASRMAEMQRDIGSLLPPAFEACSVIHFDRGELVLAVPNASLSARLRQMLPKLQEDLTRRGWRVEVIRLKVQFGKNFRPPAPPRKTLALPEQAVSALADLHGSLEDTPQNQQLKAALEAMLMRHIGNK